MTLRTASYFHLIGHTDDDDEIDDEDNYRSRPPPPVPTSRQSSSHSTLKKDTGFSSSSMSKLNTGNDSDSRYATSSARGPYSRDADDGFRSSATGGGMDSPGEDNQKTPDATARYQKARYSRCNRSFLFHHLTFFWSAIN